MSNKNLINLHPQTDKGRDVQSFLSDNPDTKFYMVGWTKTDFRHSFGRTWDECEEFRKETDWNVICYCDEKGEQMMWQGHRNDWRKEQGLKPLASPSRKVCDYLYSWTDTNTLAHFLTELLLRSKGPEKAREFFVWLHETYWYCKMFKDQQTEN